MENLGMAALGVFIGWVTSYGVVQVKDWGKPGNVFSAVVTAAVGGGVFAFIQFIGQNKLGDALFMYPVGLIYGVLCNSLGYMNGYRLKISYWLHLTGFIVATLLMLVILLPDVIRKVFPPHT